MVTLYERLDSLCKEHGIKGGRMCVDLGISKSLMTDLKSGRKKGINAETAQKIADYFGVSVGYLLGKEERAAFKVVNPVEDAELHAEMIMNSEFTYFYDAFQGLDDNQRRIVMELMDTFNAQNNRGSGITVAYVKGKSVTNTSVSIGEETKKEEA